MFCPLTFRIVHHALDEGIWGWGHVFRNKLYLTRDLVDDACIPPHIAVPKPAAKLAPKAPAKGDAKGKKQKHVQELTMR